MTSGGRGGDDDEHEHEHEGDNKGNEDSSSDDTACPTTLADAYVGAGAGGESGDSFDTVTVTGSTAGVAMTFVGPSSRRS